MGLLLLKAHLKDQFLRFHADTRKGTQKIGDLYDWTLQRNLSVPMAPVRSGNCLAIYVQPEAHSK
jgi:hypothetical protein